MKPLTELFWLGSDPQMVHKTMEHTTGTLYYNRWCLCVRALWRYIRMWFIKYSSQYRKCFYIHLSGSWLLCTDRLYSNSPQDLMTRPQVSFILSRTKQGKGKTRQAMQKYVSDFSLICVLRSALSVLSWPSHSQSLYQCLTMWHWEGLGEAVSQNTHTVNTSLQWLTFMLKVCKSSECL